MKKGILFFTTILFAGSTILIHSCKKEDVMVESIALDKTNVTVAIGSTETLMAVFTPTNTTNKNIIWRSDKQSIATVSGDGVITGVALGEAVITTVSKSDSTAKATCDVSVVPASGTVYTVSGNITEDTHWYKEARYKLDGFVFVKPPATLTIDAGTVIMGVSGTKGTLIIERGAKIMAAGTSSAPIVFTSDKPKGQRSYGDWGGVVICGYAATNKSDGGGAGLGIAEGGIGSIYGGGATPDNADNSGVLQYVRIEFPGIPLTSTANSEINGLTLYAVGSGTTIDHIQVSYSGDDSYEWFGGTVNCKYLVAIRGQDDDFDTDNGFSGKIQFFASLRDPAKADQSGSNGFESDNDADGSTTTPITSPIFVNGTVLGPLVTPSTTIDINYKRAMHIRRGSRLSVYNSIFAGWPVGLFIDGAKGDSPTQATNNVLQIENCVLAGMTANFDSTSSGAFATVRAWFTEATRHNLRMTENTSLQLTDAFNLTAPNFLPSAGSLMLSGASFANTRLTDAFFTQVAYRGAFGTTDWTSGWCNFDPQNTDY
jgi:hypothetical protein